MNLGCEKTKVRLDDWLDGLLPGEAADEIRDHLSFCHDCRALFERHRAVAEDLLTLDAVAHRIADSPAAGRRGAVRPLRWISAAGAVAAALLLSAYALWNRSAPSELDSPAHPTLIAGSGKKPAPSRSRLSSVPGAATTRVTLAASDRRIVQNMETEDPRIHVVWLYDTVAPPQNNESPIAPTTAPGNS
jgi:hypothetical protein